MLWGNHAQALASGFEPTKHKLLCASHPSPLSATKGTTPFIGCGHFGIANQWLTQKNREKIDWLVDLNKIVA
jgi:uracil-DNA glycosylase